MTNAESVKRWKLKNPERARAMRNKSSKKWRETHPEQAKKQARAYMKKYKTNHPDRVAAVHRRHSLKRHYNLSADGYQKVYSAQGGLCAICKRPETMILRGKICRLSVDHDHDTGKVRGLLCNRCNRALGLMGDEPTRLRAGAEYLERAK